MSQVQANRVQEYCKKLQHGPTLIFAECSRMLIWGSILDLRQQNRTALHLVAWGNALISKQMIVDSQEDYEYSNSTK